MKLILEDYFLEYAVKKDSPGVFLYWKFYQQIFLVLRLGPVIMTKVLHSTGFLGSVFSGNVWFFSKVSFRGCLEAGLKNRRWFCMYIL